MLLLPPTSNDGSHWQFPQLYHVPLDQSESSHKNTKSLLLEKCIFAIFTKLKVINIRYIPVFFHFFSARWQSSHMCQWQWLYQHWIGCIFAQALSNMRWSPIKNCYKKRITYCTEAVSQKKHLLHCCSVTEFLCMI